MKIRDIQGFLYALLNKYPNDDSKIYRLIEEAKETIVDILMEGASKQDILEAILELLIVATLLKIDVEKELSAIIDNDSSIVIS